MWGLRGDYLKPNKLQVDDVLMEALTCLEVEGTHTMAWCDYDVDIALLIALFL